MTSLRLIAGVSSLLFLSVVLSLVHPFGDPRKKPTGIGQDLEESEITDVVRARLELACADCHSENTRYPLYSHVAPISWLLERDIIQGRQSFNMSHWRNYTNEDRIAVLSRIASEVHTGGMPLRSYLILHPAARLSVTDQDAIYAWAKSERKLIRAVAGENASSSRQVQGKSEQ